MFDAGFFELLVVFTLGLLVLGPERLPRVARSAGRWIAQARGAVTRFQRDIERELALEDLREHQRALESSASALKESTSELASTRIGANADADAPRADKLPAPGAPDERAGNAPAVASSGPDETPEPERLVAEEPPIGPSRP